MVFTFLFLLQLNFMKYFLREAGFVNHMMVSLNCLFPIHSAFLFVIEFLFCINRENDYFHDRSWVHDNTKIIINNRWMLPVVYSDGFCLYIRRPPTLSSQSYPMMLLCYLHGVKGVYIYATCIHSHESLICIQSRCLHLILYYRACKFPTSLWWLIY